MKCGVSGSSSLLPCSAFSEGTLGSSSLGREDWLGCERSLLLRSLNNSSKLPILLCFSEGLSLWTDSSTYLPRSLMSSKLSMVLLTVVGTTVSCVLLGWTCAEYLYLSLG